MLTCYYAQNLCFRNIEVSVTWYLLTSAMHSHLDHYFSQQLRFCLTHPPSHSTGHNTKERQWFQFAPFGTRVRNVRAPNGLSLFNILPRRVRFGRRGEASTRKRWRSHLHNIITLSVRARGLWRKQSQCERETRARVQCELNVVMN